MKILTQIIGIAAMITSVYSFQLNKHKHIMIVSMVLNTITFSFIKPKLVRRTILIASPFMLVYNILTGSIGGIINEIFAEISSVVGMFRHDIKKKDVSKL